MSAILCSQCSAPLSVEAAQGHVPCKFCGAVNAPATPQMHAHVAFVDGPPAPPAAATWVCPACRHENQLHYQFCLGCGASRPARMEPVERTNGADANPAYARPGSPVGLIVLIVALIIGGLAVAVTVMFLSAH